MPTSKRKVANISPAKRALLWVHAKLQHHVLYYRRNCGRKLHSFFSKSSKKLSFAKICAIFGSGEPVNSPSKGRISALLDADAPKKLVRSTNKGQE
jgi:hypothetical protein